MCFTEELSGVFLEKPHIRGHLKGSFRFPKRCGYQLQLSICLQSLDASGENPDAPSSEAEDEVAAVSSSKANQDVKFYIGSDFDSLQEFVFQDLAGKVGAYANGMLLSVAWCYDADWRT